MDIKSPVGEARNDYTYSASGQKLKVYQKWNPAFSTSPVIGSDVNVSSMTQSLTTDYIGNKIYENGVLKRTLIDGGYIEGGVYYYYLNDHLGNNRMVVNASGAVIQKTHYYPFGMAFAESTESAKQPYKYNGKELDTKHGLNTYDYSARYMDPAIGRFTSMDPLAEKYYSISPYVYVKNNPLKYIDPTGMVNVNYFDSERARARGYNDSYNMKTLLEFVPLNQIGTNYVKLDGTGFIVDDGNSSTVCVDLLPEVTVEPREGYAQYYPTRSGFWEPTLMELWSESNNPLLNISYNIINDAYVSIQPFTFGAIGARTNEFTGGIAYTNLNGSTNYKGIQSFINTTTWFLPTNEARLGLQPLKTLNASQFSHTFKGSLSRFSPSVRGALNKAMNKGSRFINTNVGSGDAVMTPVSIGTFYNPEYKVIK